MYGINGSFWHSRVPTSQEWMMNRNLFAFVLYVGV